MRIGRHVPINTNAVRAAEMAAYIGCNAIQIFASNPTGWSPTKGGEENCLAFAEAARQLDLAPVVLHAPYLINLASPDSDNWEKSIALLRWTLQRGELLGASYVVFHMGSHKGSGVEAGLTRIAQAIERILPETPPEVVLLLENSVGAGNSLGGDFEHLAATLSLLPDYADRLGVCLDTAHLWGYGYDISTEAATNEVLHCCDETVGLQRLKVLHLNETEKERGSHRDVHARIGEGIIGEEGLRTLLCDPRLAHVAVLLETPIQTNEQGKEDWEHDKAHLDRVKLLMQPVSFAL
ncbi:MAG TPA: deoxyribonuclease IV [Ktedonobacteraceae bacterium]|nr:deoxyribonuclease IV [Ktedonobacteraceae bacterium]